MRTAVLDLGTNVFNLLLAEFSPEGCRYLREVKSPARLGAGGLASGRIAPQAFETARSAMAELMEAVRAAGGADRILPLATSAVRDAENGADLVRFLNESFGISVQVIPGEREAELIFKGIAESLRKEGIGAGRPHPADGGERENILMLDIGGGSNEFIISDGCRILWKRSFPLGMARMRERFDYTDPLPAQVQRAFEAYCTEQLQELWERVAEYAPGVFVGSSGSFDTFRDLLTGNRPGLQAAVEIPADRLAELNLRLAASTGAERMRMPGMSAIRVDYIVLASVFTQLVLSRVRPRIIYQSSYSLKEGAMAEEYEKYQKGI